MNNTLDDDFDDLFFCATDSDGAQNAQPQMRFSIPERNQGGDGNQFFNLRFENLSRMDFTECKLDEILGKIRRHPLEFLDKKQSTFRVGPRDLFQALSIGF